MNCECMNWERTKGWLTKHHPNCPKYDPEKDAIEIITELVRGVESWASDEDGVHDDCWEAYKKAKFVIGETIMPQEDNMSLPMRERGLKHKNKNHYRQNKEEMKDV